MGEREPVKSSACRMADALLRGQYELGRLLGLESWLYYLLWCDLGKSLSLSVPL